MIKKVSQVVDIHGQLKTTKCPKCKQDAMYFNFHNTLICRNCCYMPKCPTCNRYYLFGDIFEGEHGVDYMKKPEGYQNIKEGLSYLIGQLAGILGWEGGLSHPKSKEELVYDIDRFLKSYNDSYHLGVSRYTDKDEDDKSKKEERIQREIKWKEEKIKEFKSDAEYHKNWHKERIKELQEEIKKLKL